MMKLLHSVICLLVGFCCVSQINGKCLTVDDIEGYYWRHYSGKIPPDALLGGMDKTGQPTYIGQTVYNGILIPGKIIVDEQKMYYEWGDKEREDSKNFKILCTQEPHRFEWIRTNKVDIQNLTEKNFIYGGFESDYVVYIGRVQVNDELAVGKVLVTSRQAAGLHTTSNGTFVHVSSFEVLNYDPDVPDLSKIRKSLAERNMYQYNSTAGSECYFLTLVLALAFLFLRKYC